MKNYKYHTVGTVLKSNRKIIESEKKSIPLTRVHVHVYMIAHFPGLVQILQSKVAGLN